MIADGWEVKFEVVDRTSAHKTEFSRCLQLVSGGVAVKWKILEVVDVTVSQIFNIAKMHTVSYLFGFGFFI